MAIYQLAKIIYSSQTIWVKPQSSLTFPIDYYTKHAINTGKYLDSNLLDFDNPDKPIIHLNTKSLELLPEFWNEEERGPIPLYKLSDFLPTLVSVEERFREKVSFLMSKGMTENDAVVEVYGE